MQIRSPDFFPLRDLLFYATLEAHDEGVHVGVKAPLVQQESGRFHADAKARAPQDELRRRTRCGAGDRSAPRPHQDGVQMPGDNACDLGMRPHDRGESIGMLKAVGIQARHAGPKRRMVHREDRWSTRVCTQFRVEPRKPLAVDEAAAPTGRGRIEGDDAHWPGIERVARVRFEGP